MLDVVLVVTALFLAGFCITASIWPEGVDRVERWVARRVAAGEHWLESRYGKRS